MPVVPTAAPAPLATPDDLASRMETTFSVAGAAAADVALRDVSAAIRFLTGMSLEDVTDDAITLDGSGEPVVLLPDWPVQSVTSVAVTRYAGDGAPTSVLLADHVDYEWSAAGVLTATSWKGASGCFGRLSRGSVPMSTRPVWPDRPRCIAVVYDHAPDQAILDLVQSVCLEAAARVMVNPDGTVRETIGNYSYELGSSAGAVGLLDDDERSMLKSLRGVGVR